MSTITATSKTDSHVPIQENKLFLIWSITTLLVVMNTTMFNVAIPFIIQDFSLNSSTASWLVSGYSIVFAISTLTFSRLSDFISLSRLIVFGISILGLASIIGFLAHHYILLLIARVIQATGAGGVMGLGMILAARYLPIARRGKAMAMIASAASLAFGLGPVVGGIIIQFFGWNYLFIVTIFSVLSIPFILKLLPKEVSKKAQFDFYGASLTALSVTGLLVFLSTFSFWVFVGSVVLLGLTWVYLNKVKDAFIPPDLLRNKQFSRLAFIGSSIFLINFCNLFVMPIMLTVVFNKSPIEVGMFIFPGAIIAMVAGNVFGRLMDRVGRTRPFFISGLISLLSASLLFAFLSTVNAIFILVTYMIASIGFTMLSTCVPNEVTRILSKEQSGAGMGVAQLLQFFGGGIGVALAGLLLTVQENFPPEIMYRNIFIILALFMVVTMVIYGMYQREVQAKLKQDTAKSQP